MRQPKTPNELRRLGGLKWTYHDLEPLAGWVAEMDYGLAPAVADALHDAIERGDTGYPYPALEERVSVAASSFWADQLDWQVSPDLVFPAPDVIEGIRRAIVHLTRPGSPVVLHSPVYFPFFTMVEMADREWVQVTSPRDAEGVYRLDLNRIDEAFSRGAGSLVLCNPWNPTGRVLTGDEVEEVVDLARRHDARVIADEIHSPIVYEGRVHHVAAKAGQDTVITVTSASKAWNLPGLRCAQVVLTNEGDRKVWADEFTMGKVGVSTLGLIANEAAYRLGREWFGDVLLTLESNRKLLTELVGSLLPRAGFSPPEGTFLAWLDLTGYGVDSPAQSLLAATGVALNEGTPFGEGGAGHVRLNFATFEPILIEMVERMGSGLPTGR